MGRMFENSSISLAHAQYLRKCMHMRKCNTIQSADWNDSNYGKNILFILYPHKLREFVILLWKYMDHPRDIRTRIDEQNKLYWKW